MTIRVRYFASLVDLTGVGVETVELDSSANVAELWAVVSDRHPGLRKMGYRPMVACDMDYSDWDRDLDGVSEVAFLPPVSGG